MFSCSKGMRQLTAANMITALVHVRVVEWGLGPASLVSTGSAGSSFSRRCQIWQETMDDVLLPLSSPILGLYCTMYDSSHALIPALSPHTLFCVDFANPRQFEPSHSYQEQKFL